LKGEVLGFDSPLTFTKVPKVWSQGSCILKRYIMNLNAQLYSGTISQAEEKKRKQF